MKFKMKVDEYNRLKKKYEGLKKAIGGFLWLGNNLHNIKADPERFKTLYEAALADVKDFV